MRSPVALACSALLALATGGCFLATSRTTAIRHGFDYELGAGPIWFRTLWASDPSAPFDTVAVLGPYGTFRLSYGFNDRVAVEANGAAWIGWPLRPSLQTLEYAAWFQSALALKVRPFHANSLAFVEYRWSDFGVGWTQGFPVKGDEIVSVTVEPYWFPSGTLFGAWTPYVVSGNVAANLYLRHGRVSPNLGITLEKILQTPHYELGALQVGVTYCPNSRSAR